MEASAQSCVTTLTIALPVPEYYPETTLKLEVIANFAISFINIYFLLIIIFRHFGDNLHESG